MTTTTVPSKMPEDFVLNIENLDKFTNSTSATFTDRLGGVKKTIVGVLAEYPNASGNAAASEASRQASAAQAGISTTQAGLATAAKVDAVAARDAAMATGKVYASTAAGLAATTTTQYFSVPSALTDESLILYLNNAGTAVEQKRYPSTAPISALQALLRDEFTEAYAYTVRDASGRVALGVKNDGSVVASAIQADTLNGSKISDTALQLSSPPVAAPAFTINDAYGRTAFEVAPDGTVSVGALKTPVVNGGNAVALRPNYGGTFDAELTYFNSTGQSLSLGPVGGITKSQEYDNIGFPDGYTSPGSPSSYLPLTAGNCSLGANTESPVYGAMGSLKALIAQENGITYTTQKYQLLATNNNHGSYTMASLKKGQPLYNSALLQAAAAKSIAATEGRTFAVGGVFWTQGEADSTAGYSYYLTQIKALANDYNTDLKAISGQAKNIPFITYQTGSTLANKDVALAQLQASLDLPNLIYMACPMYQFDYLSDGVHVNADSSKWFGGYFGLCYKRIAIDNVTWTPTRPVSALVQGTFANVKFNLMVRPLVLDTALVPAQVNYGFTLVDSGGADLPIASLAVVGPDTIKVTAVSTIPAGAKLRYGFNTAVGKGGYVSGCGNLRDSQGEIAAYYYRPLHNWCVFFEFDL